MTGTSNREQAAREFMARVASADPINDPLSDAESHGGYDGFRRDYVEVSWS